MTDTTKRLLRVLPLDEIDDPALPSRAELDEAELDELADNIRVNGLILPVIVFAKDDGRFEIVAGHRRTIASRRAGLVAIEGFVYPSHSAALMAVQYAENRFRQDLKPTEEAILFAQLLEQDCGGDVDVLAGRIGEKRERIERRLNLLYGDQKIFQALERGDIKVGVAEQLNRIDREDYRRSYLHQAISGGATVAVVSGWVSEYHNLHKLANPQAPSSASASAPSAVPETNFFTCALCAKTNNVHTMQAVNIHAYCKEALWADVLAFLKHRGDWLRAPRSVDEASALINDLAERFGLVPSE